MPVSPLKKGTQLCPYLDHEGKRQFRFKLIKNAGSGTFGNTYSADDVIFGDVCIIKEFAFAELCNRDTKTGSIVPYECEDARIFQQRLELQIRWLDRFELEARNLITIYHTNVISVRLVWRERGTAFYAMNKVEGEELLGPEHKCWQAKSWPEVESIAFKLLDALEAVHDVQLIHGDVKPSNVLLTSKGDPVLIDFGAAWNLAEFQAILNTNTHAYTPGYAPPELHGVDQIENAGLWSDLYSWAMMIIGLLAKHPQTTYGPINVISRYRLRQDPYSDLASWLPKDVPSNVLKVLQKCVQLDYTERPQNVEETRNLFASKPMVFTQTHSEDPVLKKKIEQLQKSLEEKQSKAEKALQKEKTKAEQERTKTKQAEKALQEERNRVDQEKSRTKQVEQTLKKTEETLQKEKIKISEAERELLISLRTLQKERNRADQEQTRANKAEQAFQREKIRANKTEQALQREKTRANKAEQALQKEKTRANKAEQVTKKPVDIIHVRKPKPPKGFVLIPAGSFMMGSPETEKGRYSDEFLHKVNLTRSFYVQQMQVTQAQWKALMGTNPSYFKGDSLPVEQVNWFEACAYANALSRKEGLPEAYQLINPSGKPGTKGFSCSGIKVIGGDLYLCKGYRLPMEAEWEYAARAGTKTEYYNGDDVSKLNQIAWDNADWDESTHPVGKKKKNPWGLYDMSGNVWEWCWDWYGSDYYKSSSATDPTGSDTGSNRVYRGGSWSLSASFVRSANRSYGGPSARNHDLGFRLFRSAP